MYVLILPALAVILLLSVWLLDILKYVPPPQPVFEIFMKEERGKVLFFLTIFVSVFGPIVEEIFFRGFLYGAVKKRIGIIAAAFLTGAIFSLLHTNITGFLPIMTLGVVLAYLYETTGSLIASMTVHVIHNSIILMFVFFIKQLV
jgi:membrane protease YdiL (CAAX protease family)